MSTQSSFASDAEILQDAVEFIKTSPNASQQDVVNYLLEGYNPIDPAEAGQFARDAFQQIEQAAAAVPAPAAPTAHPAISYLLDLFLPGDCIDLFYLHRTTDEEPYNYFTSVEQAATEQEMRDVATNQQNGYNAYVGMNAYKPGGGRSKQNIASIRSVYVEHDDRDDENDEVSGEEGRALIAELVAAGKLPKPHYIIRSSMNPVAKYQTVWLVESFSVEQQESLNRAIRNLVKSDPASCDAARVLRLPGTLNLKYDPPGLVEIVEHNPGPRYTPGDFKIETEQPAVQPAQSARVPDEDNAFKQLAADAGYRPFECRIGKQLEPGATIPCPMPWHKHKDYTPCFGPLKSAPDMLHCLGNCQFSGDVIKAVFEFDNATTPGKYPSMLDAARQICLEENLKFEEYFPAPGVILFDGRPAGAGQAAETTALEDSESEPEPSAFQQKVDDLLAEGKTSEQIYEMSGFNQLVRETLKKVATESSPNASNEFTDEIIDKNFPGYDGQQVKKVPVLIEGFLPKGCTFFGALAGGSKTWAGLAIAKALTTGEPLFGRTDFTVPSIVPCLYLIPEASDASFKYRMGLMRIPQDKTVFRYRTISQGSTLRLTDPLTIAAIKKLHAGGKYPQVLVIVDTAIRFMTGKDENAAVQNSLATDADVLRSPEVGADLLFMHHSTKRSTKEEMTQENVLRGSGDLAAMADCVYGLRRDEGLYAYGAGPEEIEVSCVKPRDIDPPPAPFRLRLHRAAMPGENGGRPVSVIQELGNLEYVQPKDAQNTQADRLDKILRSNPLISNEALNDEMKMRFESVRELAASRGWTHQKRHTTEANGQLGKKRWVWTQVSFRAGGSGASDPDAECDKEEDEPEQAEIRL